MTLSTIQGPEVPKSPINTCVDFGAAWLVPGNELSAFTQLSSIKPERKLHEPVDQDKTVRAWLIEFGADNGYQNVEQDIDRHTQL